MTKSCPVCGSELSKKWQSPNGASGHTTANVLWSCGVCGAAFTRTELRDNAKPPAKAALLASPATAVALPFTNIVPKIVVE